MIIEAICDNILFMLIETDPSFWRQERARNVTNGLDTLKEAVRINEQNFQAHPESVIARAIDNFVFINDQVSPIVEGFYELSNKKLEFKKRFGLSPASLKSISYNSEEIPNRLVYGSSLTKRPTELTIYMIENLWNANTNRDAIESLARLSKEQIIDKFIRHISFNK